MSLHEVTELERYPFEAKMLRDLLSSINKKADAEPGNAHWLEMRGLTYLLMNNYDQALVQLLRASKELGKKDAIHWLMCECHLKMGQYGLARQEFARANYIRGNANYSDDELNELLAKNTEELEKIKRLVRDEMDEIIKRFFSAFDSD